MFEISFQQDHKLLPLAFEINYLLLLLLIELVLGSASPFLMRTFLREFRFLSLMAGYTAFPLIRSLGTKLTISEVHHSPQPFSLRRKGFCLPWTSKASFSPASALGPVEHRLKTALLKDFCPWLIGKQVRCVVPWAVYTFCLPAVSLLDRRSPAQDHATFLFRVT